MNPIQVKLNDLPDLPFELVLSCLSVQERIKCRAVSLRWCRVIDSFRPKSLWCSKHRIIKIHSGLIYRDCRWTNREYFHNFIRSTRLDEVFRTFGQSILSSLKNLRLCEISLDAIDVPSFFQTISSFSQLEELDIIQFDCSLKLITVYPLRLNLPMLKGVRLEKINGIIKLTLDAPRLKKIEITRFSSRLDLVYSESVEELIIDDMYTMEVKYLKNLQNLYLQEGCLIHSTLLSTLDQLKEIHLTNRYFVSDLFEQKERYGRSNLRIFSSGRLLNDFNDPAIQLPINAAEYYAEYYALYQENYNFFRNMNLYYRGF